MRLIDADALLQEIEESANAVEIQIHLGKCNKDVAKGMLSGLALVRENVLRKPTAYDTEKVVAEIADLNHFNLNLADRMLDIQKNGTHRHYICAEDAIDIVRKGGVDNE